VNRYGGEEVHTWRLILLPSVNVKGFSQKADLLFQSVILTHDFTHIGAIVLFSEGVHLYLKILDQLLVAAPDVLLGYSVVLSFSLPLLF
jgi:hypothetical protein